MPKLQIYGGEWITITGPNGAGKSTLLLALMHLVKQEGIILLCGNEITSPGQVAGDIGFVFQNPELQFVAQSVREEVMFTLNKGCHELGEKKACDRVNNILEEYGLKKVAEQNPYQLSTGQQRRLSVAATTVKKRIVLLLDEPTFGQDAVNTFNILEQLETYRQAGTAILMVTHDLEIVKRFATRRWQIEAGELGVDRPGKRIEKTKGEAVHVI